MFLFKFHTVSVETPAVILLYTPLKCEGIEPFLFFSYFHIIKCHALQLWDYDHLHFNLKAAIWYS